MSSELKRPHCVTGQMNEYSAREKQQLLFPIIVIAEQK